MSVYKYLPSSTGYIRLLKILPGKHPSIISCAIDNYSLQETEYVALSYEWGSRENQRYILVESQMFSVTRNLYEFLTRARGRGATELFWIDSICIDQTDETERSEQVMQMGNIYSYATETWVWLGAEPLGTHLSFANVFDHEHPFVPKSKNLVYSAEDGQESNQEWLCAMRAVCNRGYWNRLWIAQEFLKSRSLSLILDDDMVPGSKFIDMVSELGQGSHSGKDCQFSKEFRTTRCWRLCNGRSKCFATSSTPYDVPVRPLEQVLADYGEAECSDWHDRVYGLLSLTKDGEEFPVDYSVARLRLALMTFALCQVGEEHDHSRIHGLLESLLGFQDSIGLRFRGIFTFSDYYNANVFLTHGVATLEEIVMPCQCTQCQKYETPPLEEDDEIYQINPHFTKPGPDKLLVYRRGPEGKGKIIGTVTYVYSGVNYGKYDVFYILHSLPGGSQLLESLQHDMEKPSITMPKDPAAALALLDQLFCANPAENFFAGGVSPAENRLKFFAGNVGLGSEA